MNLFLIIVFSYLIGSIPTAFILVKIFKGKDIRKVGSGNPGTTNVIRTTNVWLGLLTFIIDFLKGFIPVLVAKKYYSEASYFALFFAVLGHIKPIFLRFSGGKGVATFFGALFGISQKIFFISATVFILVLLFTHIVSISSLTSIAVCVILFLTIVKNNIIPNIFLLLTVFMIMFRHKDNIVRLLNKQEKKIF